MNDNKTEIKEKILKLLEEHPEGLTLKEISKALNLSRITTRKYLLKVGENGSIVERKVGSAILYYHQSFLKRTTKSI